MAADRPRREDIPRPRQYDGYVVDFRGRGVSFRELEESLSDVERQIEAVTLEIEASQAASLRQRPPDPQPSFELYEERRGPVINQQRRPPDPELSFGLHEERHGPGVNPRTPDPGPRTERSTTTERRHSVEPHSQEWRGAEHDMERDRNSYVSGGHDRDCDYNDSGPGYERRHVNRENYERCEPSYGSGFIPTDPCAQIMYPSHQYIPQYQFPPDYPQFQPAPPVPPPGFGYRDRSWNFEPQTHSTPRHGDYYGDYHGGYVSTPVTSATRLVHPFEQQPRPSQMTEPSHTRTQVPHSTPERVQSQRSGRYDLEPVSNLGRQVGYRDPADSQAKQAKLMYLATCSPVKFDGSPRDYPSFEDRVFDTFGDNLLSDGEKIDILPKFLSGAALLKLQSLRGHSFGSIINRMKQAYGHPRLVVNSFITQLTSGPQLKAEEREKLQQFSDTLLSTSESLVGEYLVEAGCGPNLEKILGKLPQFIRSDWEKKVMGIVGNRTAPSLRDLAGFVDRHARNRNNPYYQVQYESRPKEYSGGRGSYFSGATDVKAEQCVVCSAEHRIWRCPTFLELTQSQRFSVVKDKQLCFVCLCKNCGLEKCPKKDRLGCTRCDKPHNKLLKCYTKSAGSGEVEVQAKACGVETEYLMCTLPVRINGPKGSCTTYAFVDSGSQASFIDEKLAWELGIDGPEVTKTVSSVTNRARHRLKKVTLELESIQSGFRTSVSDNVFVICNHDLCSQIRTGNISKLKPELYAHLRELDLPTVDYAYAAVLLGLPVVDARTLDNIDGAPDEPFGFRTNLGVGFGGPLSGTVKDESFTSCGFIDLAEAMDRFVRTEDWGTEYPPQMSLTAEDKRAEEILGSTVVHRADGHYECGLLWRDTNCEPNLPFNRPTAERRFKSLEAKFAKDPEYKRMYSEAMNATIENGWASVAPSVRGPKTFYISHFGVVNPNKPGKVRPVFDLKEKTNGVSLNDCLMTGPDVTSSLCGVLLRARQGKVCVVSDIKGMFSQCFVSEPDRDALRFLWYEENGRVTDYRMNVHVFGAADSPYCATALLRRTADDNRESFDTDIIQTVFSNFYVDDVIFSQKDTENAIRVAKGLKGVLAKGGFELVKISSNDRNVLKAFSQDDLARPEIDLDLDDLPSERTLGLKWNTETDTLGFSIQQSEKPDTMRGMLSTTARLFDPLGYAAPVILKARLIMRTCWEYKLVWDQELPPNILRQWVEWKNQLPTLENLSIPRRFFTSLDSLEAIGCIQLHVFADSSELATGCCAYLRAVCDEVIHVSTIVCGKAKLLSRKPKLSIPRAELKAAVDAVRLGEKLKTELGLELNRENVIYWTDSQIVLSYINNESTRFHVFVANRQSEIRMYSDAKQWRHVPGELNPSDEASRGLLPSELTSEHRFVVGPDFLKLPDSEWPEQRVQPELLCSDPEVKVMALGIESDSIFELLNNCSSLRKVKKIIVRMLRLADAKRECRKVNHSENVSVDEMEKAENVLVRIVQRQYFADEICKLENGVILKSSSILDLTPFIGADGLLRVGGRLRHSETPSVVYGYPGKHPVILPPPRKSHLSRLLLLECHAKNAHGSQEFILGKLRERFWIIHARSGVRRIIHECPWCRIRNVRPVEQLMGEVPDDRLKVFEPCFTVTGTDLFGPIVCKERRSHVKHYGVIFLCMTTAAIHIEVVRSLSTDDFLMALMRFVAIRGGASRIRSDNGSNYVGAERELRELVAAWDCDKIAANMEISGIVWTFQTPYASSQSGYWERRVKEVKRHLYAILGRREPTPEVLHTALYEVSAILNSVPLCPVSSDPGSLDAITPGNLLFNRTATVLVPVPTSPDFTYKTKYRQVQQISDSFWKRFTAEFVPTLLPRKKWKVQRRNLQVGDLVVIFNPDLPRCRWNLGRVLELFPGRDGNVRNVSVKTKDGVYQRPIQKLGLIAENEI